MNVQPMIIANVVELLAVLSSWKSTLMHAVDWSDNSLDSVPFQAENLACMELHYVSSLVVHSLIDQAIAQLERAAVLGSSS